MSSPMFVRTNACRRTHDNSRQPRVRAIPQPAVSHDQERDEAVYENRGGAFTEDRAAIELPEAFQSLLTPLCVHGQSITYEIVDDLQRIATAWPMLPERTKAAILNLVGAAKLAHSRPF
jgi:hypothetical protein